MSNLERRGGRRPTRSQREQRAFNTVVATGVVGTLAVVTFVLAIAGVTSFTWFVGCIIGTIIGILMFRRNVS